MLEEPKKLRTKKERQRNIFASWVENSDLNEFSLDKGMRIGIHAREEVRTRAACSSIDGDSNFTTQRFHLPTHIYIYETRRLNVRLRQHLSLPALL